MISDNSEKTQDSEDEQYILQNNIVDKVNTQNKVYLNQILKNKSNKCNIPKKSNYIWKNAIFNEKIYELLTSEDEKITKRYKYIYKKIENILMGNFGEVTKAFSFHKDFFTLSLISACDFNESTIDYLLFTIYFDKKENDRLYFVEYLEFVDVAQVKSNLKMSLMDFLKEHQYGYIDLEYDELCLIDENVFFSKIEKNENNEIYRYPYNIIIKESDKVKKVQMMDREMEDKSFVDIDKLIPTSEIVVNVLENLRNKENLDYDLFIINDDITNFKPSKTEKYLINHNNNLILSGRPGTGKTFIIILKTVLSYLNCWKMHSEIEIGEINWDYLNEKHFSKGKENMNQINNYKIVVTSLSQNLCLKGEELFSQTMRSLPYHKDHVPNNRSDIDKMNNFQSIKKYPLFVNFRKLIFLIDGSLNFQFFDRPTNNKLNKLDNDIDIKYVPDYEYDINYKNNIDKIGKLNIFYRSQYGKTYKGKEMNEDIFYKHFNEKISNNNILNNKVRKIAVTTYEVYSQIISIIKGSHLSYLGFSNSITLEKYKELGKKLMFTEEQKEEIYKYYKEYEIWKEENNYFDFQDVVNFLIRQVHIELVPKNIKLIDILFIDEVQDFSINQLYLMTLISRDIKVLAGDTCQTISKTNTFRFKDLNSIYNSSKRINKITKYKNKIDIKEPEQIQTYLNFRCHFPVLKLAHLIFEMIYLFFPQTLDKVKCDFTKDISGYKPSIITDLDSFINKLIGRENNENNYENNKKEFTFAINHCFICRNTDSEKKLNEKYNKKILTSTISQSKGMEYEIVIIYNFFNDAYPFVLKLWREVLNLIKFEKVKNTNIDDIKKQLEIEEIDETKKNEVLMNFKEKIIPVIRENYNLNDTLRHKFFNMCSEFKELYVAITRARTSLFFYDEDKNIYPSFIKILNEFKIINEEEDQNKAINYAIEYLNEHLLDEKQFRDIAEDNLKIGEYKKAEFYFNILNDEKMAKKALALFKYDEINKMKNINKNSEEFKVLNKELLDLIKFNKLNLEDFDVEGEIYINLKMYEEGLKFFKDRKNKKKCGIIYQLKKEYRSAFKLFQEIKEYGLAIDCLISDKNYTKLFNYIISNQNMFDTQHFFDYFKKYAKLFIRNYKINFEQNKMIKFSSSQSRVDERFIQKNVIIREFHSIFDDQIINAKDENKLSENQKKLFPKIENYNEKEKYIGINQFKEKHFFYNVNRDENIIQIQYLVNDKVESKMFPKYKCNNISKTDEEIMNVFDKYLDLFNLYFSYISFRKNNLEQNIINYIDESIDNIKKLKEIKYNFIENIDNYNKLDLINKNVEKEKLDVLLGTRVESNNLIEKLFKDWNLENNEIEILNTQLLKTNIVPYFIKNFPLLIMHKTNDLENIKKVQSTFKELLNETLRQIVILSKKLPLKEKELIKCLESSMILTGHFKPIFPFLSTKTLSLLSALLKKSKIFNNLLITQNISFMPKNLKKGLFTDDDNFFYIFNSFLSLNLCKYFNYRAKCQLNKNWGKRIETYNELIRQRIEYLQEYPKLYSLLYKFESSFQILSKVGNNPLKNKHVPYPISYYIREFTNFLLKNEIEYNDEQFINLIEIGNTISMYITINGLSTTRISKEDYESYDENMYTIARFLIKIKELLIVYEPRKYKYLITVFSLFSALGISLIPQAKELKVYNIFPCGLLNNSSIIIWPSEKYHNYLEMVNKISLFDSSSKNRIIFYNNIFNIFNQITHRAITKIFNETGYLNIKIYSFLDSEKFSNYFDELLYNYSIHRKNYLENICSINIKRDKNNELKLANELNQIVNSPKAKNCVFNFGFYENFCITLCNWPGDKTPDSFLDYMLFPFHRWDIKNKNEGFLNFTQISLILGELPMPFETLIPLQRKKDYNKFLNIIFDINENLFNDIFYLYKKINEIGTIYCDKNRNFIQDHELNEMIRIFRNYILFSLLMNNFASFKYTDFYNMRNIKPIEELFDLIDYNKVKYENEQNTFPYKIVLHILKKYNNDITKVLKIIWIKKLFPFVVYSLKKLQLLNNESNEMFIYGINDEIIDFRYFNKLNISLKKEEIILYFEILDNFINKELYKNEVERNFHERLFMNMNKFDRRNFGDKKIYQEYLYNYIELQLFNIFLTVRNMKISELNILQKIKDDYFKRSFYIKNIINKQNLNITDNKYYCFSFNIDYTPIKVDIKIKKLTIKESNKNSEYELKNVEYKEIMYKNFLNQQYLFINNHKEEESLHGQKEIDKKYMNEIINFLFVPLQKETLPQYLQTTQKIYKDFWNS